MGSTLRFLGFRLFASIRKEGNSDQTPRGSRHSIRFTLKLPRARSMSVSLSIVLHSSLVVSALGPLLCAAVQELQLGCVAMTTAGRERLNVPCACGATLRVALDVKLAALGPCRHAHGSHE